MTNEEYLLKCRSVADVLTKIINGAYVSPEERLKACADAIDVFYRYNFQNKA